MTMLMGADGPGHTTDELDACAPNTYLVYHGGRIVCEPTLPNCPGQLLHAGPGGDLAALSCTPKYDDSLSNAVRQRVLDLQGQAQSLIVQLDALGIRPALAATFVGTTAATTVGRIEYPGTPAGLPAANARCAAELGLGAHMCAAREMLGAVLNATLDPNKDVPPAWLYMPTWNTPAPGAEQPLAGLGDNCGGYTDGTLDHDWTGMAVDWSYSPFDLMRVLHFKSGTLATCDQSLPIACCR